MVAKSSAAQTMAALVAQKFDLHLDRDRELIRQLCVVYIVQDYERPPPSLSGIAGGLPNGSKRAQLGLVAPQADTLRESPPPHLLIQWLHFL
jgi:hypothetical protein